MMNNISTSFRKDLGHSLMIIEDINLTYDIRFHIKMLKLNALSGLLPVTDESLNGRENLLYDISSKQSFEKVFEVEKMGYDTLTALINSMKTLRITLEEYLLDLKYIVFRPGFIFTDSEREKFYFCYYPSTDADNARQVAEMQVFFNQLLSIIDYSDPDAVSLAFSISRVVQNDGFTLQDIPSEITSTPPENLPAFGSTGPEENNQLLSPTAEILNNTDDLSFWKKTRAYFSGKCFGDVIDDINDGLLIKKIRDSGVYGEPPGQANSFQVHEPDPGEAFTIRQEAPACADLGNTASINTDALSTPFLIGTGLQSGVKVSLDHFPFTIGKKSDSCDLVIDDPTISRSHCRLYEGNGSYYFEDLNSTNGSFINDERVEVYTRKHLNYGDLIKISSQEFYFR